MRGASLVAGLVTAALLGGATRLARAQPVDVTTADSLFREGQRAYQRGDNRSAALAFEEAYRRAPHGAAIFNAALAWDAADEPTRAADDLATAQRRDDLDAPKRAQAGARLHVLEQQLGRIAVLGAPATRISIGGTGAPVIAGALVPVMVHVRPGVYEVKAQFVDGSTSRRSVDVAAGAVAELQVAELHVAPVAAPSPPPLAHGASPSAPPPAPHSTVARPLGIAALAVGVVGAGVAIGLGSAALSARDEFNASDHTDASARSRATDLRTGTNVAWIASGGLAAAGAGLLIVSFASKRSTAAAAFTAGTTALRLGPGSVVATVSF